MSSYRRVGPRTAVRPSFAAPFLALALAAVFAITGFVGCASSSGAAGDGAGNDKRSVVVDGEDMTNRRFRLKILLPDYSEILTVREGQTVRYQQPDGVYTLVPRVSRTEIGQVEVFVRREQPGGNAEEATGTFRMSQPYDFSHEVKNVDWPYLLVEVLSVQPPLRPGL